jgi:proteasome lid subunit RPN8/RPN11
LRPGDKIFSDGQSHMKLAISSNVLESCLLAAIQAHPQEFLGLLSGSSTRENAIAETLYLAPLSHSDEGSVSFDEFNMPVSMGIIGTFHSHPTGPALPSKADLRLFSLKGPAHLIACFPYNLTDVRCFDSKGKNIEFEVSAGKL